jgi:ABC-2 type transport system ATP-binding protein
MEPIIEVRGLSKDFLLPHLRRHTVKSHFVHAFQKRRVMEIQHALRDIEFEVAKGEFFGVVGRNGSGKSTLLKILAGIYPPTSGQVQVHGRLVPFIELGVGFNAELTGRENVYLNGAMMGFSRDEIDDIYDDIVSFAELQDSMDQKLKNYSSGMQVRIAFSLATRARGDILLVDEVLAVGDAAFQRKCYEHFRALKNSETTIVFVTHAMDAVREFCDRALLIEDSRILAMGKADDVAEQYSRLFVQSAHEARPVDEDAPPQHRWGEGGASYGRVSVPEVVTTEPSLCVEVEIVAYRDMDDLVCGYGISNSGGTVLMGTNTSLKRTRLPSLKSGERLRAKWFIDNVFSDGLHYLDLSLHDRQGLRMYDYWKQAASFTVVRDEKTPFLVTPDSVFEVE